MIKLQGSILTKPNHKDWTCILKGFQGSNFN